MTASVGSDNVVLYNGSIAAGGSCQVTVLVTSSAGGIYNEYNGVVTSANGGTGNTANATLYGHWKRNLSITKTDGTATVNAGGTTTYTIVVTNAGPSPANGAVFTDPAATGLSATGVTCGSESGGAVCPTPANTTVALMQGAGIVIPTLPSGSSVTFTVIADVTATSGSVANVASIAPPTGTTDPNNTNDSATDTNTINDPPVANDDSANTQLNTPVTFSATANDTDSDGTINVATVDLDPATAGTQTTFTVTGEGTFTVDALGNVTFTPIATFTGTSTIPYTVRDNDGALSNQADLSVTVNVTDLTILKEVSADGITWTNTSVTVGVGDTVYYRITVDNTGSLPLNNVNVTDSQCTLTGPTGDTNGDSRLDVTETWFYTCSVTAVIGTHTNIASVTTTEIPVAETDDASYTAASADLLLTKTVNNPAPKVGDNVTFTLTVTNGGPSVATNVTVADVLPTGLSFVSASPSPGTSFVAPVWTIPNLGIGSNVMLQITSTVTQVGAITNFAQVTASDQDDPDLTPNNNATLTPAEDDEAATVLGSIFDPPSALKTFDATGLPELEFRMVWINSSNTAAIDVQVTDQIPVGTTYVAGSVTCAPQGLLSSTAPAATLPLSPTAVPTSSCGYDLVENRIQWQGTIGPDDGRSTEGAALYEVVITFRVRVNDGVNQVMNQGFSRTDVDDDSSFVDETVFGTSIVGSDRVIWNRTPSDPGGPDDDTDLPRVLPATGFAPNVITTLPEQPAEKAYALTDVRLEIPSLAVNVPIVGVPVVDEEWNLSWLDKNAGWLNGTAFPSWKGNSVLTAHVGLSNGKPGPFANLGSLKWGDQVIVHVNGQKYIYEVRANRLVSPSSVSSVTKHEEYPWLTLITCKSYDEKTGEYTYRTVIRAVLVKVVDE